jgi:hypothetical protein
MFLARNILIDLGFFEVIFPSLPLNLRPYNLVNFSAGHYVIIF